MVSVKGFKQWLKLRRQEMIIKSLAIGMNSTIDITKDMHIVMLDYDIPNVEDVVKSIYELQDFYNLSDAYIYATKNGFHTFFWYDHVPYGRLKQIIDFAMYVDPMFKYISRFYDHRTIRCAGKYKHKDIKFVMRVESKRAPSKISKELGDMKRAEHNMLSGVRG